MLVEKNISVLNKLEEILTKLTNNEAHQLNDKLNIKMKYLEQ